MNEKLFPDYEDLVDREDVRSLAAMAKDLGLTFKIGGFPFGADPETHRKTLGLQDGTGSAPKLAQMP